MVCEIIAKKEVKYGLEPTTATVFEVNVDGVVIGNILSARVEGSKVVVTYLVDGRACTKLYKAIGMPMEIAQALTEA